MSAQSETYKKFLTLKQAAEFLSVSVDTLIEWNDSNIFKPTITQTGEIVYTQEQINKFLAIQELLRSNINTQDPHLTQNFQAQVSNSDIQKNIPILPTQFPLTALAENIPVDQKFVRDHNNHAFTEKTAKKSNPYKIRSFVAVSASSFIVISILIVLFTQQNKSGSLLKTEKLKTASTAEQVDQAEFMKSTATTFNVPDKNQNLSNELNQTDTALADNKLAAAFSIFGNEVSTAENYDQTKFVPFISLNSAASDGTENENINYRVTANYASRPNYPLNAKDSETVFDDDGNIKGEAGTTDLLATNLDTAGLSLVNVPSKRAANQGFLIAFFTLSLVPIAFAFKKQLNYAPVTAVDFSPNPVFDTGGTYQEKILEIDQKTDGTVVLYFRGKECKVSKPELNSESDQFIERLLSFADKSIKEIDYDILKDDKIRLYAPLSKIVTRLGFVGLKRDLFFPRTSKNRVLFRRFLTSQDLASMGLTADEISAGLIN